MKRYWISAVAVILAFSGIAVYYSIGTRNHLPDYKLETVQGNPEYGQAVGLTGSYYGDMRSEPLAVNMRGSEYGGKNLTFRHSFSKSWLYDQSGIKALVDGHRSFMRGKKDFNGFYRDAERVIYAEAERVGDRSEEARIRISLDVLNEKSGKHSLIENTYPLQIAFDYLYIVDVQTVEDQVFILIQQLYFGTLPGGKELFVIDINNGKLLRNELIDTPESEGKEGQIEISIIKPRIFSDSSRHIILNERTANAAADEYGNSLDEVPASMKLYSYDYVTGKVVHLPDHYSAAEGSLKRVHSLQNDIFYLAEFNPTSMRLSRYDLSSQKDEFAYTTIKAAAMGGDDIKSVQIAKDRVYVLLTKAERAIAAVLDLQDGKLLYSGKPAVVGDSSRTEEKLNALHLLNLEINERFSE